MSTSTARWLRGRVELLEREAAARGPRHLRSVSPSTTADRVQAVCRSYRELWALGYQLRSVEGLATRHLRALLLYWQSKDFAASTMRVRWSHLVRWCAVIGKPGMAPPFAAAQKWLPERPLPSRSAALICSDDPAAATAPRKPSRRLSNLDETEYARLVERLRQRRDLTGYWLVRCVRELRLSRQEAGLFEPAVSWSFQGLEPIGVGGTPPDLILVWSAKGRAQRVVSLPTPQAQALVVELAAWMRERGRQRLGWRNLSLTQMIKRHTNLLGYAMSSLGAQPEQLAVPSAAIAPD
jgi:hypothetical protein